MSQFEGHRIDSGDVFPALELRLVGGGTTAVPGERLLVLNLYRGHW